MWIAWHSPDANQWLEGIATKMDPTKWAVTLPAREMFQVGSDELLGKVKCKIEHACQNKCPASRMWPSEVMSQMGIMHVRGMLLHGPSGCGKTLIVRQIGKALSARDPKTVNGPEILNKFVGGSEEKIRELFADVEKEHMEAGDASVSHIIMMDEMDAICEQRGSVRDGTGISDSVVNQLLSEIDGVDSLNNVLLIGMTNQKDVIDDALSRPGRLEVHAEIGLPDLKGRNQILGIHTKNMKENNCLTLEVIDYLPEITAKNSSLES